MKILIIDAYNMIHRARFGFARGEHAITFNFFRSLKSEITKHRAEKVYVVSEGMPKHRLEVNPDYKGQRKPIQDVGFHNQKREILELCKYFPITFMRHQDYECDDVIGHLCRNASAEDEVTIISSDSDFIQLLELDNVKLWNPVKKTFVEKWPVDYVVWKSLKGDPTDNVPGIKGVGGKTALSLAKDQETLDSFLDADPERRRIFESAYGQILLASLDNEECGWEVKKCKFNEKYIRKTFTDFGFTSIIDKSWDKWKKTMEDLNNVSNKYDAHTRAAI